MQTRALTVDDLTASDIAAWGELADAAAEPNPFYEPDFVLPAVRHLMPRGVSLLVVSDEAGWIACLPVQLQLRPVPHVRAWLHPHSFATTPLLRADRLGEAAGALLDGLLRRRTTALAWFASLPSDGPAGAALRSVVAERDITPVDLRRTARAALLPRGPNDEGQLLGSKQRSELRRKLRRLGEAVGAEPELADRAGDPAAVERLLALEHAGWKGEHGASMVGTPGAADLFRDVCRAYATQGRLVLLELSAAGRALAMTSALRAGDGVFGWTVGHDVVLHRYSPGVQVQVALGERVLAEGPHVWLDSCAAPENETQNRLWPDERALVQVLLPTRSPLTPLAASAARRRLGVEDGAAAPQRSGAPQVAVGR